MTTPHELGAIPDDRRMTVVDKRFVAAPLAVIFKIAADVEQWPALLPHYRFVRFHNKRRDGGGLVEMSANRPFALAKWRTWWTSLMSITPPGSAGGRPPSIRFRHVRGVTAGMEVEWQFEATKRGTTVRIVHVWNGPAWPLIGELAARRVIGPVFVHGIASRTLAGLAHAAERMATDGTRTEVSSG